ncbi:MAG: tandem-95 repeat protein [Pseudomonadales bacterium]|nr:tandem-95 repeat protein [Pseudomonadales bacterium]
MAYSPICNNAGILTQAYLKMRRLSRTSGNRLILPLLLILLTTACGGGGGGSSSNNSTPAVNPNNPANQSGDTISFSSNAIKGPLANSQVLLTDASGFEVGNFTAANGNQFDLEIPPTAVFPIIVTTQGGVDSFTNQNVSDINLSLKGVIFDADQVIVNINPISTLMIEIAQASNTLNKVEINQIFSNLQSYNFGLPEGFNPISSQQTSVNAPSVLMAYETFFEAIRRTSNVTGLMPNEVIIQIAADFTDGILDGIGTGNTDAATTAIFNGLSSAVLLESLAGELILDSGGNNQATLTDTTIQTATLEITGTANETATASLPPSERVLTQTSKVLIIAAAATTDTDDSENILNSATTLTQIERNSETTESSTVVVRSLLSSISNTLETTINDSTSQTIAASNETANDQFSTSGDNSVPTPAGDFVTSISGQLTAIDILANDPEVIDGLAGFTFLQEPTNGNLTINPNNTIGYVSDIDFFGTDSFVYAVFDQDGDRGAASVTITVTLAPTAKNDIVGVVGAQDITIDVLANDENIAEGPIVLTIDSEPSNGTASVVNNKINYSPTGSFTGTDNFSYLIVDASGDPSIGQVNIIVSSVLPNTVPVAINDIVATLEQQVVSIDVLANDLSLFDQPISVAISSAPDNGTANIQGSTISYVPETGFFGTDSLDYQITDGNGDTAIASLDIQVEQQSVEVLPIAINDSVATTGTLPISLDVLLNDLNLDNLSLIVSISTAPVNGTTSLTDNLITYTANTGFSGNDMLSYRLTDNNGNSVTADVFITVETNAVNPMPIAIDDEITVAAGISTALNVIENDLQAVELPLLLSATSDNATITVNGTVLNYLPDANFGGFDTFEYTLEDASGDMTTAEVVVFVDAIPVSQDKTIVTGGIAVTIDLLEGATGIQNPPIQIVISEGAERGTLSLDENLLTYLPVGDIEADDSFKYTIIDANGDLSTSLVSLIGLNRPTITGLADTTVQQDAEYSFTPVASDRDPEKTLVFTIENKPGWANFNTSTGQLSGIPANEDVRLFANIEIAVSNGETSRSLELFNIEVININDIPTLSGTPATQVLQGANYSFLPNGSDIDATDTLTFSFSADVDLPSWLVFDNQTGSLTGTPANADIGNITNIILTVSDGQAAVALPLFNIEIINVNDAPTISGIPSTIIDESSSFSFTPAINDIDLGDTLSLSITLDQALPNWLNFDTSTGALSGVPGDDDVTTLSNLIITVSDGNISTSLAAFNLQINNVPPELSASIPDATEDEVFSYQPNTAGASAFSATGLPAWASINNQTGLISGTPANDDVGSLSGISITASDNNESITVDNLAFSIINVNDAPTISGSPTTSTPEDSNYSFTPTGADVDASENLTFSITNQPVWTSFDTSTGALSGIPDNDDVGIYVNVTISVKDNADATSNLAPFDLNVTNVNDAPTISGTPATSVTEDNLFTFSPAAVDIDIGDNFSFSINQTLPAWLSFDQPTGVLSGTPGDSDVTTLTNLVISVNDGEFSASLDSFDLQIINNPPTISGSFPTATQGQPFTFEPIISGAKGVKEINLPAWATFDASTGVITGTPENIDVGSISNITITAFDNNDSDALENLTLTVFNVNDPPTLTGTAPLFGFVNFSYSFVLTVDDIDVDSSLTLGISPGFELPSWATFDISDPTLPKITGTPTSADLGSTTVKLSVDDGIADPVEFSFQLEVIEGQKVYLAWDNPTSIDASQLNGYEISYSRDGGSPTIERVVTGPGGGTTWASPELNLGLYTFTVLIFDLLGDTSEASDPLNSNLQASGISLL